MRILITGVLGQDGSYLAEQLIADGHEVYGMTRRFNVFSPAKLVMGDMLDQSSLEQVLDSTQPDVVYNLAAITSPGGAWGAEDPPLLAEVTGVGVVNLMEAMTRVVGGARLVHASSSAIYHPHRYGLYGIAKKFAHDAVAGYRTGFGLHASNAVMYSHTSIRQDKRFLARTIVDTFAARGNGSTGKKLVITDLNGLRDWGYAPDFMRALPLIANMKTPGDIDVATGMLVSVGAFIDCALEVVGLTWEQAVEVQQMTTAPREHPADIAPLLRMGWKPEVTFREMVQKMMREALW
jgi:GDPmannose 4,6-dehydratase